MTTDAATRERLWRVRKGLYTAVAGARPAGSTALLEDVAVPVADLTATVRDLGALFERRGYGDAVTFGHAKDGNLHFMITPRLGDRAELDRYAAFSDDLVDLVLGHGGTLKAEHGTGRIMAPFVRRQYGDELYAVMREVKRLLDPHGLLNPGVVLTDDDHEHLRNLKVESSAGGDDAALVDRCVECGYCEPGCPSRTVTTTPRQPGSRCSRRWPPRRPPSGASSSGSTPTRASRRAPRTRCASRRVPWASTRASS